MAGNYISMAELRNMSESSIPMLIPRRMLNSNMSQFSENPTMLPKRLIIIRRRRDPPNSSQDGSRSYSPAPIPESSNLAVESSEESSNSAGKLDFFIIK